MNTGHSQCQTRVTFSHALNHKRSSKQLKATLNFEGGRCWAELNNALRIQPREWVVRMGKCRIWQCWDYQGITIWEPRRVAPGFSCPRWLIRTSRQPGFSCPQWNGCLCILSQALLNKSQHGITVNITVNVYSSLYKWWLPEQIGGGID